MEGKTTLNFKTYLFFLLLSFFHPNKFIKAILKNSKSKKGILFFIINLQIGIIIFGLIKVYLAKNSDIFSPSLVFFPTMSEAIFITPIIGFGFLTFILFLYFLAKFIGGVGSLRITFLSSAWTSAPLVFIWIPYLQIPAITLQIYLLIKVFLKIHLYPKKNSNLINSI